MNQLTPQHNVDTMARLSTEDIARYVYGAVNAIARGAARLYLERFPNRHLPGHRMFANLHRWLREHGRISFTIHIFETCKC